MKKNLSKWLALLLACLMMLASCGGDEPTTDPTPTPTEKLLAMNETDRAAAIVSYIEDAMDGSGSYTMEGEGLFKGTVMGQKMEVGVNLIQKHIKTNDTLQLHYSKAKTAIKVDDKVIEENEATEGFYDGKMFLSKIENGKESGVYSEISAEDYLAHKKEMESDNKFTLDMVSTMTCVQNADKTWTATYKGFEDFSAMENIVSGMDQILDDGVSFSDLEMSITADENFVLQSCLLEFLFEIAPGATATELPVYQVEYKVKDLGNTKVDQIAFENLTKLSDLRIAERVAKAFLAYPSSESGSYTAVIQSYVDTNNSSEGSRETDTVEFKNENGKFSFSLKAVVKGSSAEVRMTYADGELVTDVIDENGGSRSQTQEYTETAAKRFLIQNMNPSAFDVFNISNIEVVNAENGVYKFTIKTPVEPNLPSNANIKSISATIEVTIKDGKLISAKYKHETSAWVGVQMVTLETTSTVTFHK